MKTYHLIVLCLILMGSPVNSISQNPEAQNITYSDAAEADFNKGISEYQLGKYASAKALFLRLVNHIPPHQQITSSYLMLAKSQYRLKEYENTLVTLINFITTYPQTDYMDDARYLMGNCLYKLGKYENSVEQFLWITDQSKNKKLLEKSRNLSLQILEDNLSKNEIESLHSTMTGESSSAILTIKLAQSYNRLGNKNRAISLLQKFNIDHPNNPYNSIVKEVIKNISARTRLSNYKVGVLLPLSSEFSEQAKGILAGVQYAQQEFNKNAKTQIELDVRDSEGSIMNCIRLVKELAEDEMVIAIVGELESEITASIVPMIDQYGVPLIPPLASANGLAALSRYVFQINGDQTTRGALFAEFAVKKMGYRTFATLAPADDYGKEMTDSFTATVDELDGIIVAQKWYYEDTQDIARQLQSIREAGFKRMNKDSLMRAYTRNLSQIQKSRFREDNIPVTSIDAIFLPIYTEDIQYIIPQFAYANIQAKILGGQYWYNIDELRKKDIFSHVSELIFVSDYFLDDFHPEFQSFKTNFRKTMGRNLDMMEYSGYDAFMVISDAMANNALSREDLRNYLENMENYKAKRGTITFKGNNRINKGQRFIKFTNGRFELVE